jgi:hypothetical protein
VQYFSTPFDFSNILLKISVCLLRVLRSSTDVRAVLQDLRTPPRAPVNDDDDEDDDDSEYDSAFRIVQGLALINWDESNDSKTSDGSGFGSGRGSSVTSRVVEATFNLRSAHEYAPGPPNPPKSPFESPQLRNNVIRLTFLSFNQLITALSSPSRFPQRGITMSITRMEHQKYQSQVQTMRSCMPSRTTLPATQEIPLCSTLAKESVLGKLLIQYWTLLDSISKDQHLCVSSRRA